MSMRLPTALEALGMVLFAVLVLLLVWSLLAAIGSVRLARRIKQEEAKNG